MILVTGATGKVGRNVVEQLAAAGENVRAISRNPQSAALPDGVEVVHGDLAQPESLPAAVRGADRAFLFPVRGRLHGFMAAAREAGLGQVVLMSADAVTYPTPNGIARIHEECERAVTEAGVPWTILRPGEFMANDLNWARGIRQKDVVRAPGGDVPSAVIDERDIAAVAVRVLREDGHEGKAYSLTGPQSLTVAERVRIIGEALGRPIRHEEQPLDEARELRIRFTAAEIVDAKLGMIANREEAMGAVSPTVEEIIGRAGHTYAEWVAHHLADLR